jgi:hypothetical protein
MNVSYKNIAPFLSGNQNKISKWLSYGGLGIGVLLLLCCLQMYFNLNALLKDKNPKTDGYDYISVTKKITNDNMGEDHSFNEAEVADLKQQKSIVDATPLLANKFLVKAIGSSVLPFTTDLFLESLDNSFIDSIPPNFTWEEGQNTLPAIMSADYLELYNNVFAPSKDLPQFSEKSIGALYVQIECHTATGEVQIFKGHIVGLSDRINSVLVPANFLKWANKNFANTTTFKPQRVFIKTKDANSVDLLNYIQSKDYSVNKDKTKFGRVKQILQAIVSGLSGFGILVILLAMVLFSFYLQLMIARSKDNLQLLLTLGYSPNWLSKIVAKRWVPVYIIIVTSALIGTILFQYVFKNFAMKGREELSPYIHFSVAIVAMVLLLISILINYRMVKKLLLQLNKQ